jgi:hypothetical protein
MDDKQAMLQMRAVAIQFLRALEDDMIARGLIAPHDRACITRQERRARIDTTAADVVSLQ